MSITTKTGDTGETGLLFSKRASKSDPRVAACGDVDELSAAIGLAKAHLKDSPLHSRLETIQNSLIALMGEIATLPEDETKYRSSAFDKLTPAESQQLESWINELESSGLNFKGWALPGGSVASAHLDFARTVCRRAERTVVGFLKTENNAPSNAVIYLNRLSDLLWLMARSVDHPPSSAQLA